MNTKRLQRKRRAKKTRSKISLIGRKRLTVFRSNHHIYAQIISSDGSSVLVSASTLEKEVRETTKLTGNKAAAAIIGSRIAKKAKQAGIKLEVAFDRSGFSYHGRIKELADAARTSGLKF